MTISDRPSGSFANKIQTGLAALEEGASAGVPIHYIDGSLGDGMIRHFPDGTRERLLRIDGNLTVVETLTRGVAVAPR